MFLLDREAKKSARVWQYNPGAHLVYKRRGGWGDHQDHTIATFLVR